MYGPCVLVLLRAWLRRVGYRLMACGCLSLPARVLLASPI